MKRKLLILFLTCVVGWLSPLNAQTNPVEVGEKNGTSKTIPTMIYDGIPACLSQQIYTSTELQEAGLSSGSVINSIAFMPYTVNASSVQWSVYMVNTEKDNFTSNKDYVSIEESSEVFSGSLTLVSNQWVTMELENPFTYNGNNLLICVVDNNGANASFNPNSYYYYNTSEFSIVCAGTSSLNASTNPTDLLPSVMVDRYAQTFNYRNIIQFTIGSSSGTGSTLTVIASVLDSDKEVFYTGETITLEASVTGGTAPYSYSWSPTDVLINASSANPTFTPTSTGEYIFTCTVTDNNNNEESANVTINVTERPVNPYAGKQFRVKVEEGTYTGYYLNVNSHDTPQTLYSDAATRVGVSQKSDSNTQIFTIEMYDSERFYLRDLDGYLIKCDDQPNSNGRNTWDVDAYSETIGTPLWFEYYDEKQFYIRDYDKYLGNGSSSNSSTTNNYFKVENQKVYCDATIDKYVDESHRTVRWSLEECVETLDFKIDLSKSNLLCDTEGTIQLSANVVSGNEGYTYAWTGEGISDADKNIANPTVIIPDVDKAIDTCVYTCTVSDAKGQTKTEKVSLYVCDVITDLTLIAGEITIVEGNSTTLTSNIPEEYKNWTTRWEPCVNLQSCNGGITNVTEALTETTTFTLTATNPNNPECSSVAEVTVTVTPDPSLRVEVNAENDNICDNATTQFYAVASRGSGEGYSYKWSTNNEEKYPITCLSDENVANPVFTPVENTEGSQTYKYVCTVTDSEENTASDTIYVYVTDYYELTSIVEYVEYGNPVTIDFSAYPGIWNVNAYDVLEYDAYTNDYVNNKFTINSVTEDIYLTLKVQNAFCESTTGITIIATNVPVEPETGAINGGDNWIRDARKVPTYSTYPYVLSQQIYTKEELQNLLEDKASISKIAFKAYKAANTATRYFDIYLINTDKETFSSNEDFVPIQIEDRYYSGEVTFTDDGNWTEIVLTKDFQYTNGNIILCVSDKTGHYKATMNEVIAEINGGAYIGTDDKDNAIQLIRNIFGDDETKKLSQYEAEALLSTVEIPEMIEAYAGTIVQYAFDIAETNEYYGYNTTGRAIIKFNYGSSAAAYEASDFVCGNSNETKESISYNSQIQFTYTPWAGDPTLKAKITADKTSICDGEDGNRFYLTAAKVKDATYEWYKGDTLVGAGEKITYSNEEPGTYNIKLVVAQNGATADSTIALTINQMPNANNLVMGADGYGFVGEEIGFATTEDHVAGTTYAIDVYEDEAPIHFFSIEDKHAFKNDGTFSYKVKATLNNCADSSYKSVTIYPVASFTAGDNWKSCATQETVFRNKTLTPNDGWNFDKGKGEGFVWDFGDGTVLASNDTTVAHIYDYDVDSTYTVTLTVTKSGISNEYIHDVDVISLPKNVDFNWNNDIVKEDIIFTPKGADSYLWTINGEKVSEGVLNGILTYRFEEKGKYTIGLTATSSGCSVYVEKEITVGDKMSAPLVMQDGKEVETIDLGFRPHGAWMRPIEILITPDGTTDLIIDSITIVDKDDVGPIDFIYMTDEVNNDTIKPEETLSVLLTHDIDNKVIKEEIDPGHSGFGNTATMTINYGKNKTKVINIKYNAYEPKESDVWETAKVITAGTTTTEPLSTMRSNYLLEGATSAHKDAVFKFTFDVPTQLTATVNGDNPLAYVYPADFGDEDGPGLTNYVGYVNPDAPVQLEFEGFNMDFEELELHPIYGYLPTEGELWTSGPNDAANAFFRGEYELEQHENEYGWLENVVVGTYVFSKLRTKDNYFITKDKYYISETAKFSMNVWSTNTTSHSYYVFVSEDGENFTSVYESTVSVNDKTNSIDFSIPLEYAGKEYYVGVVHVGTEETSSYICLDNIRLYEPETLGTRANADATLNIMLKDGTYYLVAAAENQNFSVTIGSETLLVPGQATDPRPRKDTPNVAAELEQLTWTFGEFTEEYQVLFGTTNPPTEVLVDWNNNIESESGSCAISSTDLMTNTVYYWQVNAKNILGTKEGEVWRFATPFDAPRNLALDPLEIKEGGKSVFTWNPIDNDSLSGYNIYIDNVKQNTSLVTSETDTISGLSYKVDPYIVQVEAVYNFDDFEIKSKSYKIELKVNAEASVEGFVYDATTGEPLVGATVTYATTELETDVNGYYSGLVPAGNYTAVARMDGYNKHEVLVGFNPSEEKTYSFNLEPTKTMATGVVATERDDKKAVDVKWQFNLEDDPMIENFEDGFTYEWTTSTDYPWEVVANGYEVGSAGYKQYGGYCVKSTNSDYDYDQENGTNIDDKDYPFELTTSYLELTAFIPFDGKISFYYRIDTESYPNADCGKFYIDDDLKVTVYTIGDNYQWLTDSKLEFDVTAGTHTFKWAYSKDEGWYSGTDAFYVDNITFYENTNLYNVYRRDILLTEKDTIAENLTVKALADTVWADENFADGIYQWGVSVEYNEPAGNLLFEDFEGVEEPETFLTDWTKYTTEEAEDSYHSNSQWHVVETSEYGISACGGTGYSAFVSPLPGESVFYFVTPVLNASRQATLEFDYIIPRHSGAFPNDFSKFKVAYRTSSTGPWTDLTAFNKTSVEDWTHATVELPLEEELYIAFIDQNVENWGLGIGLDNIRIHRVAVTGESNITWSNLIAKGNELIVDGNWNDKDNWSRDTVPTVEDVAIIKAAGIVDNVDAAAKAVLVDNGTLTIGESGVLTAPIVIDSVAADITINAGGQLVHSNKGVMATFVKGIKAYENVDANTGWYTISSPLAANIDASEVGGLLYGDFDLYRYDEPTHYWENYKDNVDDEGPDNTDWDNNSAVIEKGRGYLYANSADTLLSFAGELNVAEEVTTKLSAKASSLTGFNLLGNPFAHNIYKGVAFNGSIADAHYTLNYHGEWQAVTSGNPIKSGAGFLVQATTDADGADLTISKTNARTRAAANSMLAVTVVNNVFEDVAYVSFNDGIGLEKIGHMNEYAPMVYIPGDFNNYAYAIVEEDVTEVPVNFEAMTMGEYTIAVKAKNCEYETMILVDNLTGKETNLLKDSYTFMATTTDDPDRFVIKLAKDAEVEDSFIYINNGELIFDNLSSDAIINVFDVLGRNVATFNNCGDTTFRVSTDLFADGVYMVRVIEGNNVKVQKMVIE